MNDVSPLLELAVKLGPNGLAILNALALYWLNSRIEALEDQADEDDAREQRDAA